MKAHSRHPLVLSLVVGGAVLVALCYVFEPMASKLVTQERVMLDGLHTTSKPAPVRKDVIILGIDDASLKLDSLWPEDLEASPALKLMQTQWPWPRGAWAHILDKVFSAGASRVFIDVTFRGPSTDPAQDRTLADALKRHGPKIVLAKKFETSTVGNETVSELTLPHEAVTGPPPHHFLTGFVNLWPDFDQVVRTVHWNLTASEAEALELNYPNVIPDVNEIRHSSVAEVLAQVIGGQPKRIRFGPQEAYQPISLYQMFVPDMWKSNLDNGAVFKGKTVLIGATAADLQDFHQTPLGKLPGVQLLAHTYGALSAQQFLADAPYGWRLWCILGSTLIATAIFRKVRSPLLALSLFFAIGFAFNWATTAAFDAFNTELPSLPFLLAMTATSLGGFAGGLVAEIRESRRIQRLLERYTSPELVKEMMQDREGLYTTLGGVERNVTVFFSDVRGFTSLSEQLSATEIVARLNEYLGRMVAEVIQYRGLVDKFIGDAVMAVWGSLRAEATKESTTDDARRAVEACLAMRRQLEILNAHWRSLCLNEFQMGMGVHQGDAVVGNIGSAAPHEKMDLTVIGDSVNLASRLESITKVYGVDLVISETVYDAVKEHFICVPLDLVAVKGKVRPVAIFTVLAPAGGPEPEGLEDFRRVVDCYRVGDFEQAQALLKRAEASGFMPQLIQMYQQRLRDLRNAPPDGWTGVYTMKTK
ncbi:MAG: adenylate/guanylate cyclase domain-containing protein [Verrucomicrobiaceae bacterium]|nr:adenylate/guanylate cyclase domain-containing protein [Verrucomicrobiaceae bacterium]